MVTSRDDPVVIGVDLGTTSTKAVAFDTGGRRAAADSAGYALREAAPSHAEQDPDEIVEAVIQTVASVAGECAGRVAALSLSSARSAGWVSAA